MDSPTLLVLAAGMGSRYGGLKQIEPVGPSGETLLDYGVYDAARAGFRKVVFVIRRDFEEAFRARVGGRYGGLMAIDYVFQSIDVLPGGFVPPAGREKPWGTGHAVWCARDAVQEPFAVINADDFYGRDAFEQLSRFLRSGLGSGGPSPHRFALVGYRLDRTLSEAGTVSRGICQADTEGRLRGIVEQTGIAREDVGPGQTYSGLEPASMNCWAFTPGLFPPLDRQLREFLAQRGTDPKAEFYLPSAVSTMIERGEAEVTLLRTTADWFGVTHRDDKSRVQAALEKLIQQGVYPRNLFA